MKHLLKFTFLFASAFLSLKSSAQTAGTLDTTFNLTGKFTYDFGFHDNLTDVKIQPADQKIVSVGTALTPSFSGKLLAVRLLPTGGFDSTFNDSGIVIIPNFNESYAYESFIKNDGKIIIAGASADPQFQFSMLAIRLNEDGSLDSTFGTNGFSQPNVSTGDDFAYATVEQPDHKIILAGTALDANFNNAPTVVRLNENGSIDSTFGINGMAQIAALGIDNELTSVVLQPNGKIIVSGHYDMGLTSGGQFDFDVIVARFNTDGSIDSTFGTNGVLLKPISVDNVDDAFGLSLTSSGSIVVGGFTTNPDFSYDIFMMQLDSTGTLDLNFGVNGIVILDLAAQDACFDLDIQSDGKILVAGTSGGFSFDPRDFILARYNSNGTPDNTFGTSGYVLTNFYPTINEANSMAIQQDGKIVLAGKTYNGIQNDIAVCRYFNDLSSSLQEVQPSGELTVYPNPVKPNSTVVINTEYFSGKNSVLEIYNLVGSLILKTQLTNHINGQSEFQLPSSVLPGMYLVKTFGKGSAPVTGKLIVQE